MKTFRILLLACSLYASSVVQGAGVVIVNNANRVELDLVTIRHIFLGRTEQLDQQVRLIPILPNDDTGVRQAFYSNLLGKSSVRYRAYWAKRVFTGDGMPPKEGGSEAVIEQVMQNVDYIGIVADDRVKAGQVRIVREF